MRRVGSQQRMADVIQIPDGIKNLVPDKFIVVTQCIGIQNPVFIHDNGVFKRTSPCQSHTAQCFDILDETESASPRNIPDIGNLTQIDHRMLVSRINSRMIEFNEKIQFEAIKRVQTRPFQVGSFSLTNFNPFFDTNVFFRNILFFQTGLLKQKDKRRCRTIHNGNFFCIHLDMQIVDSQTGTSRHQMLDGGNPRTVFYQRRSQHRLSDRVRAHRNRHNRIQIGPMEYDTCVRNSRPKYKLHLVAGMQSDSDCPDRVLNGTLFKHDLRCLSDSE